MKQGLPHFAAGAVVRGFGRGSKQLGIPTANFDDEVVKSLPSDVTTGVYFGYATVDKGPVNKMVMSIGWNPYYQNTQKTMETHIMQKFEEDFYGKMLHVAVLGYIREEKNFNSLDELIKAIKNDIDIANEQLDQPEYVKYKNDPFFKDDSS